MQWRWRGRGNEPSCASCGAGFQPADSLSASPAALRAAEPAESRLAARIGRPPTSLRHGAKRTLILTPMPWSARVPLDPLVATLKCGMRDVGGPILAASASQIGSYT